MADTSSVSSQTGIPSYEDYVASTREVKTTLGKNDFLSLLATQMQYQNPLEPTTDTDFVAQLAQFSTLEFMQSMSESMTAMQYYNLTGQCVYAEVTLEDGSTQPVVGVVDRVIIKDSKAYAQVEDYLIDCTKISQIINKDLVSDNSTLLDQTKLIGKYVQANAFAEDGETKTTVDGMVTRVAIEDNFLVAYLDNGKRIGVGDIFDISDTPFETTTPDDGDTGKTEGTGETGNTDTGNTETGNTGTESTDETQNP